MPVSKSLNGKAQELRSLHTPFHPIVLANVWDAVSAQAVASLQSCSAIATASKAIALCAGLEDDELDLQTNLRAIRAIGVVAAKADKPFTVDLQDGYGEQLSEAIEAAIEAGAVGCNIEDSLRDSGGEQLMKVEEAVARIKTVKAVAAEKGVPDFVVNARTDVLLAKGTIEDAIKRGKAYLDAGATTIFVWGGAKRGGIKKFEVAMLVGGFDGMVNVSLMLPEGKGLSVRDLKDIGVARISVGPKLMYRVMEECGTEAAKILQQTG